MQFTKYSSCYYCLVFLIILSELPSPYFVCSVHALYSQICLCHGLERVEHTWDYTCIMKNLF